MATPTYTEGQSVTLHFRRMDDARTYLLLERSGRSSGLCYHVSAAVAATLPELLRLQLRISRVCPALVYVELPQEALHHSHLSLTPDALASVDQSTRAAATATDAQQLTFDF